MASKGKNLLNEAICLVLLLLTACIPVQAATPFLPPASFPNITPRRALAAAILEDHLYALGGWNGNATQLDLLQILDLSTPRPGQWQAGPPLQVARSQHALLAADEHLWVLGGWSAEAGLVSEVEALDPRDGAWQTITHLPTPCREPGAALVGDEIVVAGGFDGRSDTDLDGYLSVVEAYNLQTSRWRRLSSLGEPRRGLALVNAGGSLFAIGGYNAEHAFVNRVERYDPRGDRWVTLDWPLEPRTWAAALVLEGDILIAGGYNRQGYLDLVERVDPSTGQVCRPPTMDAPRSWLAAVEYKHGLLALGGEGPGGFSGEVEWIDGNCQE